VGGREKRKKKCIATCSQRIAETTTSRRKIRAREHKRTHSLTHCSATNELGLSETRGTQKLRVLGFKQSGHHEINLFHLPVKNILFRGCARAFFKNIIEEISPKKRNYKLQIGNEEILKVFNRPK
jgi:hypothetical protein